jgi:RND family efflux transporter MFP subunit
MIRVWLVAALGVGMATAARAADEGAARGVVRAVNEAAISSDLAMRILRLPFREGDAFKKDDVLVEFDCERLRADVKAAEAERRGHQAQYQSSARLSQMGAAGSSEVAVAASAVDKAAAVAEGLQARVKGCSIIAPFDGRVLDLAAHRYETPATNQPIIRIVDDRTLEIDMLLPASALADAKVGAPFRLVLDGTQRVVKGRIGRIGPALDIVSQTFKASGVPEESLEGVLPGMSGAVILDKPVM